MNKLEFSIYTNSEFLIFSLYTGDDIRYCFISFWGMVHNEVGIWFNWCKFLEGRTKWKLDR